MISNLYIQNKAILDMHENKQTLHHITKIVLSFSFFLALIIFGAVLASNGLSTAWIPQQVLVFFGWILLVCSILGMILFTFDRE